MSSLLEHCHGEKRSDEIQLFVCLGLAASAGLSASGHSSCAFVVPACFQLSPNKLQVLCQGVFETKCLLFGDKKTHS